MKRIFLVVLSIGFLACTDKPKFELLDVERTGIEFANDIFESDSLHIMNFEYIYNGGGVGIADLNNDDLQDIIFTGSQVPSRVYLNRGDFRFEEITYAFKDLNKGQWYSGISVVDINHDGWTDIYLTSTAYEDSLIRRNRFFINQGPGQDGIPTFIDKALEYGVADENYSVHASFLDYDLDGDLDLYVMNNFVTERLSASYREKILDGSAISNDRFYRNNGDGTFSDVTIDAGIVYEGFGLGLAVGDVNKDGYPDVYVSNDYVSNDLLYINQGNGTFKNEIAKLMSYQTKSSMGNDMVDINNDGWMDMYTMDMLPEYYYKKKQTINGFSYKFYMLDNQYGYEHQYLRNMLHLHNGFIDKEMVPYSEVGQMYGISATEWSWSPLFADFDNDGDKDLLVTNGYPKDLTDKDWTKYKAEVFGSLADEQHVMNRAPAVKAQNFAFENVGGQHFDKKSEDWFKPAASYSYGAAFADLDNDGDLDYVVNNINDRAFIYKNNTVESGENRTRFLRLKLVGSELNPMAIGAKIELWADGNYQYQEKFLSRGYISTIDPVIHFGLAELERVDSIHIHWPGDNDIARLYDIQTNQVLSIKQSETSETDPHPSLMSKDYLFSQVDSVLNYVHEEQDYIDFFNYQNIMPHKFSQIGPRMAKGDLDGDGLEDILIGATNSMPTKLYINKRGRFEVMEMPGLTTSKEFAEADLQIIDYDLDGDMDVVAAAGGYINENDNDYKHFIYNNQGNGEFKPVPLPLPGFSASVIRPCDYDHDGDLDLFIGSRIKKELYPLAEDCWILINSNGTYSEENILRFNLGMVTDAVWSDFDQDGWEDLFITREWNSVAILKNNQGKGLSTHIDDHVDGKHGYWYSIISADLDADGDSDLVLGNLGDNHRFNVSDQFPMRLYAIDFEKNGTLDPLSTAYWKDQHDVMTEYPINYFDELAAQMPFIYNIFNSYMEFSYAPVDIILTPDIRKNIIYEYHMNETSSYILWNEGKSFTWEKLPDEVQVSPVKKIMAYDINQDGNLDLMLGGNDYTYDVSTGYYDALKGMIMINKGNRKFELMKPADSGLLLNGMLESLLMIENDSPLVIAGFNRKPVVVFELKVK